MMDTDTDQTDDERCPWCWEELVDGCCEGCDDLYAANDNFETVKAA